MGSAGTDPQGRARVVLACALAAWACADSPATTTGTATATDASAATGTDTGATDSTESTGSPESTGASGSTGELDCPAPLSPCEGACVDLATDLDHCGACGNRCVLGPVCAGGVCALDCGELLSECNSVCTDTRINPEHCGGCGLVCSEEQICAGSECRPPCPADQKACGDGCVDLEGDPLNCGFCDHDCPAPPANGEADCVFAECVFDCDDYLGPDAVVEPTTCVPCSLDRVLADGPVHLWRLAETYPVMPAVDEIGGKNGTYVDVTPGLPGATTPEDTAARFGETDAARVGIAEFDMPDGEFTIEMLVRPVHIYGGLNALFSLASGPAELSNQVSVGIEFLGAGLTLNVVSLDKVFKAPINIPIPDWRSIAVSWRSDDTVLEIYFDGVIVGVTSTYAINRPVPTSFLVFGHEQDDVDAAYDPAQRFHGDIDHVAIFDRALSAETIAEHARTTRCR